MMLQCLQLHGNIATRTTVIKGKRNMQLSLLPHTQSEEFTSDDYETPCNVARAMASLVREDEQHILEPFAGTGQIAQFLPNNVLCNEIKHSRFLKGLNRTGLSWINEDFFQPQSMTIGESYDLIISNPPWSLSMDAVERSLELIHSNGRILFLMPLDWNCSQQRSRRWMSLDAHIRHVYRIPKRIDYLVDGIPCSQMIKTRNGEPVFKPSGKPEMMSGRQCYDAVFDIRPGKYGETSTFLNI